MFEHQHALTSKTNLNYFPLTAEKLSYYLLFYHYSHTNHTHAHTHTHTNAHTRTKLVVS